MEGTIGQVILFAGNFAPENWAFCQGHLMQINQYQALFSIIGITYGGNGTTNFALPDLRSRIPVGAGQGTGLSNYSIGQTGGTETNTLSINQLAAHSHNLSANTSPGASSGKGTSSDPSGNYPASGSGSYSATADSAMGTSAIEGQATSTGGGQPINNIQPYNTLNYLICVAGIYPVRP